MLRSRSINKYVSNLGSPDESIRRKAAKALSEADERAIYPLIKALRDENTGVQDAARHSLIEIGGETVAYMVVPLLREYSYLRNTALIILKNLGRVSVPMLYPLLKDKDEDVRKFAVDLLGEIRDDVLPEKVVPLISDPNANVRVAAVVAVGALGYKEAVPHLIEAFKDEEWICFSVIETLGKFKDESSAEPIAGFLTHRSSTLRHAAIEALGLIGSEKASMALLDHISRSKDAAEKSATVKSLLMMGVTPSMSGVSEMLLRMWKAGDWEERLIALKGLEHLKELGAIYHIVDIAGSLDPSKPEDEERYLTIKESLKNMGCNEELGEVLSSASLRFRGKMLTAEVIGETRCESALPQLKALMDVDKRDVRRACLGAIGKLDAPEAKDVLLAFLEDHDYHIRKLAAHNLGREGYEDAFEPLLKLLGEEDHEEVLEETVKSLLVIDPERIYSRLGGFSTGMKEYIAGFSVDADILISLSRDPERQVRLAALSGMGGLSDRNAKQRLIEALGEKDPEARRAAVIALGGDSCCYSELQSMLEDSDTWVRLYAVRALGESGKMEILPVIAPMIKDNDVPVVIAAIEAISRIGGEEAEKLIGSLSSHGEEAVREAASLALENL
jgi:HEAT repeat protein